MLRTVINLHPPPLSSWGTEDEYVSSVSSASQSSGAYKRSSVSNVPLASGKTAASGGVTDKMREEMTTNGSSWSAMGLLPVAYLAFNDIYRKILDEKGVVSLDGYEFYTQSSFNYGINPDGIFIFNPEESFAEGFDQDFVEEVCLALESALNSSSLNSCYASTLCLILHISFQAAFDAAR